MTKANSDRDSTVGRLLAQTVASREADLAEGGACLDAETLAAWMDDGLSREERAAAEAHAAGCGRCQALLAAMAKSAPEPAPAKAWWRLPAIGWFIPAAAAATALVVWLAVPQRQSVQQQSVEADQIARVNPPPAAVPPSAAPSPQETPAAQADTHTQRQEAASSTERLREPGAAPPNAAGASGAIANPAAAKPAASSAAESNAAGSANAIAPPGADRTASAPIPPAAPNPPNARAKTAADAAAGRSDAAAATPPLAESVRVAPLARAEAKSVQGFAAPLPDIVSSNPASRWRIVPGGSVLRSSDGGSTWQTQQTGSTTTLTAGSSPSPSVCWLVGPNGTVVVSTDDRSWRRADVPEPAPLVGVQAADDKTATVVAADGRKFTTADGGLTWTRAPQF